jgi:regulator of protease activity HflC (stomatin/prohibitin superfamily)
MPIIYSEQPINEDATIKKYIIVSILTVLAFVLLFASIRIVPYGSVSAVKRFGGLTGKVLEPGFHLIVPFADGTVKMSTQIKTYETSDDPVNALTGADYTDFLVGGNTSDGQQVTINYTVVFHISPDNAVCAIQTVGKMDNIVENVVKAHSRSFARKLVQKYSAPSLYSGIGIQTYETEVRDTLSSVYPKYCVTFDEFLVRKVGFMPEYVESIETKQIAEQNVQTQQFITQQEQEKVNQQIAIAKGQAEAVKINAQAEAEALNIKGQALRNNPQILSLEFINALKSATWMMLPWDDMQGYLPITP